LVLYSDVGRPQTQRIHAGLFRAAEVTHGAFALLHAGLKGSDLSRRLFVLLSSVAAIATMRPATQSNALFVFHSNPWLNLHHFARASARGGPAPTGLSDEEGRQWAAGVESYKPYAARDLLQDDDMVDIKNALRGAEGRTSLDGIKIDAGLKATLERLMPIYQRRWWPEHERANRAWIAAVQPLLERHGTALSQALTRTYDTSWPRDPIPVDLSITAGPNGAYTTGPPTHVTISSSEPSLQGLAALEMLFHESSHSAVSDLFQRVRQAASEQRVSVPPQLWHAVLFYTAGELTARELKAHGIAYTPYGGEVLYTNLCGAGCREKIAEYWTPHLDGKRSVSDSLAALVASFK
jgi:hypothetical protein